ncbi:MAG: hypothetical protein D6800_02510, partial [Candidatus Zixiibacteriota bacterium]
MRGWPLVAVLLTVLLVPFVPVHAGAGDGGYPGAFLQLATGARPAGMGGAYLGISDDGAASLYNPSGVATIPRPIISSAYRAMQLDRTLGYVAALFPVQGDAALGLSWLYAGSGTVAERDADGVVTGNDFYLNQHQFSIIFAKRFERYISVGADFSFLLARFPEVEANSVGFDLGAMLYVDQLINREKRDLLPIQDIKIGLTVKNLAKKLSWNSEKYNLVRTTNGVGKVQDDTFPIEVGLGGSARFFDRKLLLDVDVMKNEKQDPVARLGGEYFVTPRFALRSGYG